MIKIGVVNIDTSPSDDPGYDGGKFEKEYAGKSGKIYLK